MNLLLIIAALVAEHLHDPSTQSSAIGSQFDAIEAAASPGHLRELQAAIEWFADQVAKPILASRDVEELITRQQELALIAVQARMAILHAVSAVLQSAEVRFDTDLIVEELNEQLRAHDDPVAVRVHYLALISVVDMADLLEFHRAHPSVSAEQMHAAMAKLMPLATSADICLLLALIGLESEVDPVVLMTLSQWAQTNLLMHRAALHDTLRGWDRAWSPTLDAPDWADGPTPLQLDSSEVAHVVAIFRDPPPPNNALRRALAK